MFHHLPWTYCTRIRWQHFFNSTFNYTCIGSPPHCCRRRASVLATCCPAVSHQSTLVAPSKSRRTMNNRKRGNCHSNGDDVPLMNDNGLMNRRQHGANGNGINGASKRSNRPSMQCERARGSLPLIIGLGFVTVMAIIFVSGRRANCLPQLIIQWKLWHRVGTQQKRTEILF